MISATLCAIIFPAPVVQVLPLERRSDRTSVFETGLTRARHEPAIGATKSTRLVGLRRSLASFLFEHDLFGKPVPTFPDHALVVAVALRIVEYPEAFLELRRDRDVEFLAGGQARDKPFVIERDQVAIRTQFSKGPFHHA